MNTYDYILLLILAYFIFKGAKRGFISAIGAFAGIVIGAWAAGRYYDVVAGRLIEFFGVPVMVAITLAFIGIYLAINIAATILIMLLSRVFRLIPLATTTNRITGGLLGAIEGLLLIGLIIWVINLFPFNNEFADGLKHSKVAGFFEFSTRVVQPIVPSSLRSIDWSILSNLQEFTDEKAEYLREHMPKFFETLKKQNASPQPSEPASTEP